MCQLLKINLSLSLSVQLAFKKTWIWTAQIHLYADFSSINTVTVVYALQLVAPMDTELQIWRLTVNIQVDFWLYRRNDALTPLWLKGQSILYSVLVGQSCLSFCDPLDCSLPSSSVHRILQARILELVAISFSRGSSWLRDRTRVSCIADRFFF